MGEGEQFEFRPPAFQLYVDDWLGSNHIEMMTPAQEGAYIRLLCRAWNSPDCGLPDDDEILAKYSRLGSRWRGKSAELVRKCFFTRNGRLFNRKLLEQRHTADKYRQQKRLAGRLSGKVRNERSTHVERTPNPPSLSLSISKTLYSSTQKYTPEFDAFWKISPKTGSKKRAAIEWEKLTKPNRTIAVERVLKQKEWREAWEKVDPKHFMPPWKDMERWLCDERFNDELEWPKTPKPKYIDERDWDIRAEEQRKKQDHN